MPLRLTALSLLFTGTAFAASEFQSAAKARIENGYATVVFADGHKTVVPMATLSEADRTRLTEVSQQHPLAHGKSAVVVAKEEVLGIKPKVTIVTSTINGPLETVQLCPPSVPHDQIGGTCMLYGRVHWLDIAGYYVDRGLIFKISNVPDHDNPWKDPRYMHGMQEMLTGFTPKPIIHNVARQDDPFDWARGELRKGRPILAAFPKEIWQALPPGFIAQRGWEAGGVGHQIVINGFTWNSKTGKGTFHIINSWNELPEFDLKTEFAQSGVLEIEQSMSPKGEVVVAAEKEVVKTITFIRNAGKTNLYEVETNLGKRKIAAANEDAVRSLVEDAN